MMKYIEETSERAIAIIVKPVFDILRDVIWQRAVGAQQAHEMNQQFGPLRFRPEFQGGERRRRKRERGFLAESNWILSRLLRKAWYHWNQPVGWSPSWNMQYAYRGHVVVLCDERTASDGEIFSEGSRIFPAR